MSFAEELQKLAGLHAAGQLSDDEFAAAKRRLLEPNDAADDSEELRRRQAVSELDIQWVQTRQRLGFNSGPSPTRSWIYLMWTLFGVFIFMFFVLAWVQSGLKSKGSVGVYVSGIIILVIMGCYTHGRILNYLRAERVYRMRREELAGRDQVFSTIQYLREP